MDYYVDATRVFGDQRDGVESFGHADSAGGTTQPFHRRGGLAQGRSSLGMRYEFQPKAKANASVAEAMVRLETVSPDEIAWGTTDITGLIYKSERELRREYLLKILWILVPARRDADELLTGVSIRNRKLMKNKGTSGRSDLIQS